MRAKTKKFFLVLIIILILLLLICGKHKCREKLLTPFLKRETIDSLKTIDEQHIPIQELRHKMIETTSTLVKQSRNKKADIVLLIDRTSSMYDNLNELYNLSDEFLTTISQQAKYARFTLAFFTDHFDGYRNSPNVTTVYQSTTDVNYIRTTIRQTMNAMQLYDGGIDEEECAWDGVHDVVNKNQWRDDSFRLIILITDAPIREKCPFHGYTKDTVEKAVNSINARLVIFKLS